MVESRDLYPAATADGRMIYGYDKCRPELSAAISAKWQPYDRMGISAVIREENERSHMGRTDSGFIHRLYFVASCQYNSKSVGNTQLQISVA